MSTFRTRFALALVLSLSLVACNAKSPESKATPLTKGTDVASATPTPGTPIAAADAGAKSATAQVAEPKDEKVIIVGTWFAYKTVKLLSEYRGATIEFKSDGTVTGTTLGAYRRKEALKDEDKKGGFSLESVEKYTYSGKYELDGDTLKVTWNKDEEGIFVDSVYRPQEGSWEIEILTSQRFIAKHLKAPESSEQLYLVSSWQRTQPVPSEVKK